MFAEVIKLEVRRHKLLAVLILLLLFTINFLQAQPPEHEVKSLLIWQIANIHINWPKETEMDNRDKPFVIGIVGENSFGKFLEQVYNRKPEALKINNKIVIIRKINRVEQIPGCHLLFFIADLPRRFFSRVMESIRDEPVLTVADTGDYAEQGVHINFVVEKTSGKTSVGVVINETAARQSGFEISKELLKTAKAIIHPYRPYEEKANLLEPFTRFIDWPPASAVDDPSKPFKIQVLGHNFFGPYLDKIFIRKKIKGNPVVVRCISKIEEISNPHLLLISKSMKNKISEIIAYTKNKPILTIGDTRGFCQAGVHINFFYHGLKLSFEINNKAATAAGLNISYHLLQRGKTDTSH